MDVVLKKHIEIIIQTARLAGERRSVNPGEVIVIPDEIVHPSRKFDDIIDPSVLFGAQLGDGAFI